MVALSFSFLRRPQQHKTLRGGEEVTRNINSLQLVKGLRIAAYDLRNPSSIPLFRGEITEMRSEHEDFVVCLDSGYEIRIEQFVEETKHES